jgi:hypothetical protein
LALKIDSNFPLIITGLILFLMILGNNIYNMSLKVLTLVALVSFAMAQCPINSKIDNVDSGKEI